MSAPESKHVYAWSLYSREGTLEEFILNSLSFLERERGIDDAIVCAMSTDNNTSMYEEVKALLSKCRNYLPEQAHKDNINIIFNVPSVNGYNRIVHIAPVKVWQCTRCNDRNDRQHGATHFNSYRCKSVDNVAAMKSRGMVTLTTFTDRLAAPATTGGKLFYSLPAAHINMIAEEYAAGHGRAYGQQVWVTPELNAVVIKWMEAKRDFSSTKVPPLRDFIATAKIKSKNESFNKIKLSESGCCVNGCDNKPSGDGITISGRIYAMCNKHAESALVGLDRWFEEVT